MDFGPDIPGLIKGAQKVAKAAQIAKLVGAYAKQQQAANTQAYQPSGGGNRGGGGGVSAAPVSTLAGIPQSPLLTELMGKGLIKEGMAPEQALAILQLGQMRSSTGIDIAELMKQIEADYGKYTGDILTSGQEWMKNLYGTAYDPNDPNAALFAKDPIFSTYAGGLAQMDETADTNLATDLAWFTKAQEADQAYYDQMMTGIATGTIPAGPVATGGGGGGGGGGYRRGGYGGGGSGGDNDTGFTDPRLVIKNQDFIREQARQNYLESAPGMYSMIMGALGGTLANDPNFSDEEKADVLANVAPLTDDPNMTEDQRNAIYTEVESLFNEFREPEQLRPGIQERVSELDADIQDYIDTTAMNEAFNLDAPNQFRELLGQLENSGYVMGDNPYTEDVAEPNDYRFRMPIENTVANEDLSFVPEAANNPEMQELATFVNNAITASTGGVNYDLNPIATFLNNIPRYQELARGFLGRQQPGGPGQPPSGGNFAPTTNAEINTTLDMAANSGNPFTLNSELPESPTRVLSNPFEAYNPNPTRVRPNQIQPPSGGFPHPSPDMTDEQLAQVLPQSVGAPIPEAAIGHPPALDTNAMDEAMQAGTSPTRVLSNPFVTYNPGNTHAPWAEATPPPVTILDGQGRPQANPEYAEWLQYNQERIAEGQTSNPPIQGNPPGGMDLVPGLGLGARFTASPIMDIIEQFRNTPQQGSWGSPNVPPPPEPMPEPTGSWGSPNTAPSSSTGRSFDLARAARAMALQAYAKENQDRIMEEVAPLDTYSGGNLQEALLGKIAPIGGQLYNPALKAMQERDEAIFNEATQRPTNEQEEAARASYGTHYETPGQTPEGHALDILTADRLKNVLEAVKAWDQAVGPTNTHNTFVDTQQGTLTSTTDMRSYEPENAYAASAPAIGMDEEEWMRNLLSGADQLPETELDYESPDLSMGFAGSMGTSFNKPNDFLATKLINSATELENRRAQMAVQTAAANRVAAPRVREVTNTVKGVSDVSKAVKAAQSLAKAAKMARMLRGY